MFYISDIFTEKPNTTTTILQKEVYNTLEKLNISFQRVETDEVITMNDCIFINKVLNMNMVKTLFLCNRQKTNFYLFIIKGDKMFHSKEFSKALGIARVSFASAEQMEYMLGTKVGAATIFSALLDKQNQINIIMDSDVANEKWYGCSDGTTTGYIKFLTKDIFRFLEYTSHKITIVEGLS